MPTCFKLPVPNTEEVVNGSFTDDEWETLLDFRTERDRLFQSERIVNGMPAGFKFHWDAETGHTLATPDKPTDAQFVQVIHNLRPFVLEKEALFFPKVSNILMRGVQHPWMREQKKLGLALFMGTETASAYQLTANDLQLNTERALNLWLYALEYHRDKTKKAIYKQERGGLPQDLDFAVFRAMLVGKVDAIGQLANFITWFVENSAPC